MGGILVIMFGLFLFLGAIFFSIVVIVATSAKGWVELVKRSDELAQQNPTTPPVRH